MLGAYIRRIIPAFLCEGTHFTHDSLGVFTWNGCILRKSKLVALAATRFLVTITS